jgi:hypothetical protein
VVVRRESTYGCSAVTPVQIGHLLFFTQRDGQVVREYGYDYNTDSFIAADVSLLAEHRLQAVVAEMVYQQFPNNVLWAVLNNGLLATFTREIDQNVRGWSFQETDGEFESVAVIPVTGYDQVWVIVKRTIDGETRRYVELFAAPTFTDQEDAFYVQSGLSYDGTATDSVSGLDHLEGKSVAVLVDGAAHPNETVTNGAITLDVEASVIHVGLPYTSTIKTLRIEAGSVLGTSQGLKKRIYKVLVRVVESLGMLVGDASHQDRVIFREIADLMDSPPPLFTGDKEVPMPGGFDTDGQVVIEQDQPLPLYVAGMTLLLETFEG